MRIKIDKRIGWIVGLGAVLFSVGAYASLSVRRVLGYVTGAAVPIDVKSVGNGQYLREDAADSWKRLVAAAKLSGFALIAGSGYRSMEKQTSLWDLWKSGQYNVPSVAQPGWSNHQGGTAIDVAELINGKIVSVDSTNKAAFKWLVTNAPSYGFSWDEGSKVNEPWHWRYTL